MVDLRSSDFAELNPADALKDVIKTKKVEHRKSLKPEDIVSKLR